MTLRFSVLSNDATYNLARSVAAVDEGAQVTVTLTTTGVQNNQQLPYTISGTGITSGDFTALPSLAGNFTVQNNNAVAILTANADVATEGTETFAVTLNDSGTTVSVDINDTSTAPIYPQNLWRTLANPTPATDDYFGYSVGISGNYAIVGANNDNAPGTNSGSAYIYDVTTGTLAQTLNNPTPAASDNFGYSVGISGNLAVVGAYSDDTTGSDSGSAYVFNATTGALVSTLNNPTPATNDYFGYSVGISGNYAIVGAFNDDTGVSDAGSAYIFNATTGALVSTLANPAPATNDQFGISVGISGNNVIVGAPNDDTTGSNSGSAYIFNATTGALVSTLANPTPATGDHFGYSVAVSGNIAVVGAENDDTTGSNSGSVYVFNATTGEHMHTLANPTPATDDQFSQKIAISGDYIIVGVFYDDTTGSDSGSAYIFNATTGALVSTLANPTPAAADYFGISVGISGNYAIVGAFLDNAGVSDAGSAYIFN